MLPRTLILYTKLGSERFRAPLKINDVILKTFCIVVFITK